jgi:hypothetical protein
MARRLILAGLLVGVMLAAAGCNPVVGERISQLDRLATRVAGGDPDAPGAPTVDTAATAEPTLTPQPSGEHDLTIDPNAQIVTAWEQVYGLAPGTAFHIRADQYQVAAHIVQSLQLTGWSETVRGGSVAIDLGQIRLDLALQDVDGSFGAGTITFQPTLDASGAVRLNPRGADFGGLRMPNNFTVALGDSVIATVTGAQTPDLSRVTLTQIALDAGVMDLRGTVR